MATTTTTTTTTRRRQQWCMHLKQLLLLSLIPARGFVRAMENRTNNDQGWPPHLIVERLRTALGLVLFSVLLTFSSFVLVAFCVWFCCCLGVFECPSVLLFLSSCLLCFIGFCFAFILYFVFHSFLHQPVRPSVRLDHVRFALGCLLAFYLSFLLRQPALIAML